MKPGDFIIREHMAGGHILLECPAGGTLKKQPWEVPWVDIPPFRDINKVKKFDAKKCRKGLKIFCRKVTPVELGMLPEPILEDCVMVEEIEPGMRAKFHVFRHPKSQQ